MSMVYHRNVTGTNAHARNEEEEIVDIVARENSIEEPLQVSEDTLKALSNNLAWDIYTETTLENPNRTTGNWVLRYPADDHSGWKLLLYWAHNHALPPDVHDNPWRGADNLLGAWFVGHAHNVPAFQDVVMVKLLQASGSMDLSFVGPAFKSCPPESPIRRLLAEETVKQYFVEGTLDDPKLEELGLVRGFIVAFAQANERYRDEDEGMFERLPAGKRRKNRRWIQFMVEKEGKERWKWVNNPDGPGGWFAKGEEM